MCWRWDCPTTRLTLRKFTVRRSIDSLGQYEAARALGLSSFRVYRMVIFPQALQRVAPILANYLVAIFKDTPILSAVAIYEIMQTSKVIAATTYRYIEPYTLAGLFFLFVSVISSLVIGLLRRHTEEKVLRAPTTGTYGAPEVIEPVDRSHRFDHETLMIEDWQLASIAAPR